ncbi:MAG TPA: hypothetical protein VEW47_14860 [Candidatus Dormibacteraeota bacterium]|nr:hypothetical protein [Candidatus Dormibacteraeota bacterium]
MKRAVRALSAVLGALLVVSSQTMAGQPVHEVRGHAVFTLDPPAAIDQVTINAATDENGVVRGSMSVWPLVYLLDLVPPTPVVPDLAGWTQVIRLTKLEVAGNVAHAGGIVIFDNRLPDLFIGCPINFTVTDNGSGGSDDVLEIDVLCSGGGSAVRTILGGNFTVR